LSVQVLFNESETVVFESPGEVLPTPAGVMAKLVANNCCRNGLGVGSKITPILNKAFRADRFGIFPYIQVNRPAAQTQDR